MASCIDHKPVSIHDASHSKSRYDSPHARSHSNETCGSPPPTSELPAYASPCSSHHSPTQLRPESYELPGISPVRTSTGGRPNLGLGLNVHPYQAQYSSPPSSPPTARLPDFGSASLNPSELSANMLTRKPVRAELSSAGSVRWSPPQSSQFP